MYFYVVLRISLFCVVLCIVWVYMCAELLPPGGYLVAVKYNISTATYYGLIQGVPGGKDLTSGECSLGQTIPI
jgi:hypothetical protein